MLTGRVLFKLCSHNYECKDCAYDQFLYEYDQLLCEEDLDRLMPRLRSTRLPVLWCRCLTMIAPFDRGVDIVTR